MYTKPQENLICFTQKIRWLLNLIYRNRIWLSKMPLSFWHYIWEGKWYYSILFYPCLKMSDSPYLEHKITPPFLHAYDFERIYRIYMSVVISAHIYSNLQLELAAHKYYSPLTCSCSRHTGYRSSICLYVSTIFSPSTTFNQPSP